MARPPDGRCGGGRAPALRDRVLAAGALALILACAGGSAPPRSQDATGPGESDVPPAAGTTHGLAVFDHAALTGYVAELGGRIAAEAQLEGRDCRFHLVDDPEPNAFATATGDVFVTRGLLTFVNSEDELASVLGHEIAHVALGHPERERTWQGRERVLDQLSRLFTGYLPNLAEMLAYSREQERDADRLGQQLARRAGADPAAMSHFFRTLAGYEAMGGGGGAPGYLRTHPRPGLRAAEAAVRAPLPRPGAVAQRLRDRNDYVRRLDGVPFGPNPGSALLRGRTLMRPGPGFALRLPDGWQVRSSMSGIVSWPPAGDAAFALREAGPGRDPAAAARQFLLEAAGQDWTVLTSEPVVVRGIPTHRVRAEQFTKAGRVALRAVWFTWNGRIHRMVSVSEVARVIHYRPVFESVERSLRPITPPQLAGIQLQRLRLVAAREDETLAGLGERAASEWTPSQAALVNALPESTPLSPGLLVKVGRLEPYRRSGDGVD